MRSESEEARRRRKLVTAMRKREIFAWNIRGNTCLPFLHVEHVHTYRKKKKASFRP